MSESVPGAPGHHLFVAPQPPPGPPTHRVGRPLRDDGSDGPPEPRPGFPSEWRTCHMSRFCLIFIFKADPFLTPPPIGPRARLPRSFFFEAQKAKLDPQLYSMGEVGPHDILKTHPCKRVSWVIPSALTEYPPGAAESFATVVLGGTFVPLLPKA